MKNSFFAGIALAASLSMVTAANAQISIATAGPMTGQYASFGEQMRTGAEQAVADINAAGGVLGQQLVLEIGDDACDPKQAVAVANQMAYRVCGRDDQQGATAGAYLNANFAGKKVAFVHDKTAYGKGLADATKAAYEAGGGTAALYEAYTAGEKDYTALVTKLKQEGVDVLYVGGYHTEAGLMVRQMRDQGMDTVLISGDALVTDEYWAITGDAGEGTLMTFSPNPENNPEAVEVVKALKDAGKTTEGYVLYTYAAIQSWAQAAEAAGSTDYDAVREALNAGDFNTVLGSLAFDGKGDVSLPGYVFYEWSNGKYTQIN